MTDEIPHGTSEPRDAAVVLKFTLDLPQPAHRVWPAVATPEGLREWLAAVERLEPRLGGAVTLRWLNTGDGDAAVEHGTVTAWDPEHVAEYTVAVHGRIRFHLEPAWAGAIGTVLRFTDEVAVAGDADRLSRLAGWHQHFEYLLAALDGRPRDWPEWDPDRHRELYAG